MEAFDWLRASLVAHPLIAAAAAGLVAWPCTRWTPADAGQRWRWLAPGLAFLTLAGYAGIAVAYAAVDHYFDAAEPTMTAVGWIAAHGGPVYPALDGAERYAHVYGPLAFLAHGAALRVIAPALAVSKGLGVAAALIALWCTFLALGRSTTPRRAVLLWGGCALAYLAFRNATFWTRPEPFLLLLVASSLWISATWRGAAAPALIGAAAGLAINLKFTGVLYIVPVLAAVVARDGRRAAGIAAAAGVAIAALPFLLPNVSAAHYVDWVSLSARSGISGPTLRQNLEWIAFLLLPLAALDPGALRRFQGGVLVVCMVLVAVAGAKPGGGAYHLLPFVPVIASLAACGRTGTPQATRLARTTLAAVGIAAVAIAGLQQAFFLRTMWERGGYAEGDDLREYLASHPGLRVQVGHGGVEHLTFVRPLAVFASGAYLIDAPAVQEHQRAGLDLPAATIDALRACRADVWLLPKGSAPFDGPNAYDPAAMPALFPAAFVAAFTGSYERAGETRFFDVWRCRARPSP